MDSIDEQIRRAYEDGKFSDLPGKGKPLRLQNDPFIDPEWRLAHHVLTNGGFTLPWIEARQEIEKDLETARTDLARVAAWRAQALGRQPETLIKTEWDRAEAVFCQRIAELNKRILSYNLQAPRDQFQLPSLNFERELENIL
jgi:DnaJ family protein C protein 28